MIILEFKGLIVEENLYVPHTDIVNKALNLRFTEFD